MGRDSAAGMYGQALSFDGSNDLVTIADANDLDFTTGMTLEAWVKPRHDVTDWRTVLLKEGPDGLVYAHLRERPGAACRGIRENRRQRQGRARADVALPLNTWSHVVVTYDKTLGWLQLWVDGVERDERVDHGRYHGVDWLAVSSAATRSGVSTSMGGSTTSASTTGR